MDIEKQVIIDLYEVIRSQQKLISFVYATDHALVQTLANDASLSNFVSAFQSHHTHARKHPSGQLAEALLLMQRKLDAIGATLKRDIGGWEN